MIPGRRTLLVLTMGLASLPILADQTQPLDKLIAEAEKAGDHQAELYGKVVRAEIDAARDSYNSGNTLAAQNSLQVAVHYSDKLLESAQQHPKHLKNAELGLRESVRRLQQIERELEFEERPPAKSAREHLERVDSELLKIMFVPPGHK
jgi:hypothetical protein